MHTNKRKRSRVKSGNISGRLICPNNELSITLINISLNGALVKQDQALPKESSCILVIPLAHDVVIKAEGHIVRTGDGNAAITFDGIDPDSYPHLHRLVQLHASDPDSIDKELAQPCK